MIANTDRGYLYVDAMKTDGKPITEIDSYAKMAVVGNKCYVMGLTGETMDVCPFTP